MQNAIQYEPCTDVLQGNGEIRWLPPLETQRGEHKKAEEPVVPPQKVERVTRFERATSSLARKCSTTELHPQMVDSHYCKSLNARTRIFAIFPFNQANYFHSFRQIHEPEIQQQTRLNHRLQAGRDPTPAAGGGKATLCSSRAERSALVRSRTSAGRSWGAGPDRRGQKGITVRRDDRR